MNAVRWPNSHLVLLHFSFGDGCARPGVPSVFARTSGFQVRALSRALHTLCSRPIANLTIRRLQPFNRTGSMMAFAHCRRILNCHATKYPRHLHRDKLPLTLRSALRPALPCKCSLQHPSRRLLLPIRPYQRQWLHRPSALLYRVQRVHRPKLPR
jgi:hypothetical protein